MEQTTIKPILNVSRVRLANALVEAGVIKEEYIFFDGSACAKLSFIIDDILNDDKILLIPNDENHSN